MNTTRLNVRSGMEYLLLAIVLIAACVSLQVAVDAYRNDYGPDEASHYVTSLLVHDYLGGSGFFNPWSFAQEFFLHYPKIGLGHWPPAMYGIGGLWMMVFGDTRASALVLILGLAVTFGMVIYVATKELMGRIPAVFCSIVFVLLPLTQEATARIMPEHLVNLLIFISALQFGRFLKTGKMSDGLFFGLISAVAIMTRGSAWALGMLPIVAIVLTGTFHNLKRLAFWASSIPVVVLAIPWYYLTRNMSEGSWQGASGDNAFWVQALSTFSVHVYDALGLVLLFPAAWGIYTKVLLPCFTKKVTPEWVVLASLAISVLALHCVVPVGLEPRYMLALVPSIIIFSAAGLLNISNTIYEKLIAGSAYERIVSKTHLGAFVFASTFLGFLSTNFSVATHVHAQGFDHAATVVMKHLNGRPGTYLITSDARGEGSFVASIASREERLQSVVLRGSKILVREDWFGRGSVDLFQTSEELVAVLESIPVEIILLDNSIAMSERRAYHDRVEEVVKLPDSGWMLLGRFNIVRASKTIHEGLEVYVRNLKSEASTIPFNPNMEKIDSLMKRSS